MMAELVLKIGTEKPDPAIQDRDIITVKRNADILIKHAEILCHPIKFGFTSKGLRENGTIAEQFYNLLFEYRFVRISEFEVNKITIATMDVQTITVPKLPLYISRRLAHPRHRIFGSPGREVWYAGTQFTSDQNASDIWDMIEGETALKRNDHSKWKWSDDELKKCLMLSINDVDTETVKDLCESISEEYINQDGATLTRTLKARKRYIEYDKVALPGTNLADILDRNIKVDIRDNITLDSSLFVKVKT